MLLLDPQPAARAYVFADDGRVPNSKLPVVVYRNAINLTGLFRDEQIRALREHAGEFNWRLDWAETDAVYRYTHYHSTAHEVLVVLEGQADIQLGGTRGEIFTVHDGDVLAIPAGVAHKRLRRGVAFSVAGLYPRRQKWDLQRLGAEAYRASKVRVPRVALPSHDPLYGTTGPLVRHWNL